MSTLSTNYLRESVEHFDPSDAKLPPNQTISVELKKKTAHSLNPKCKKNVKDLGTRIITKGTQLELDGASYTVTSINVYTQPLVTSEKSKKIPRCRSMDDMRSVAQIDQSENPSETSTTTSSDPLPTKNRKMTRRERKELKEKKKVTRVQDELNRATFTKWERFALKRITWELKIKGILGIKK